MRPDEGAARCTAGIKERPARCNPPGRRNILQNLTVKGQVLWCNGGQQKNESDSFFFPPRDVNARVVAILNDINGSVTRVPAGTPVCAFVPARRLAFRSRHLFRRP
jgi:hypothetical protein